MTLVPPSPAINLIKRMNNEGDLLLLDEGALLLLDEGDDIYNK
jgi:hypothetical protein